MRSLPGRRHGRRLFVLLLLLMVLNVASPLFAQRRPRDASTDRGLVEMIKLRRSDPELTVRFLIATVAAVGLAIVVWYVHRRVRSVLRRRHPRRRRQDQALAHRGLNAVEAEFVATTATRVGGDPADLLRSRALFESAMDSSAAALSKRPGEERTVNTIRSKLGWESTPVHQPVLSTRVLDLDLPMDLFGIGDLAGYCLRSVLVHRDFNCMVVRVDELEQDCAWARGDPVQVYFWRESDAGYLFTTEVLEVREHGPAVFVVLAHPARLEREQKRLFVRTPYDEAVRYAVLPQAEFDSEGSDATRHGYSLSDGWVQDLSAGGFRMAGRERLVVGECVLVPHFAPLDGEVTARVVSDLGPRDGLFAYGMNFVGLSASERDTILRLVFHLQRAAIQEQRGRGGLAPGAPTSTERHRENP